MTTFSSKEQVIELWTKAQAVCFDVDSTVVTEEGIDVLADHCGAGEEVAAWTARAMGGNVPFHVGNHVDTKIQVVTTSYSFAGKVKLVSPVKTRYY